MVPTPRLGPGFVTPEVHSTLTPRLYIVRRFVRIAGLVGVLVLMPMGAARAATFTYASTDVPKVIPDNDFTGITSELIVSDSIEIVDLDVIFDELLHESISDLRIALTSPMGTTVVLVEAASEGGILGDLGTADNFVGTIFDDQAPTNLRNVFFDNFLGSYNIDHASVGLDPLSVFNGEGAMGTWIVRISDRARFDTGVLNDWSLRFTNLSVVPEPGGFMLFGLGSGTALCLCLIRRRD